MAEETSQDASVEETVTDDTQGDAGGTQEEEQDKPLGPAGEKALAAEKAKRKEAEAKARTARERIAELERGDDKVAQERAEFEKAAMVKANARLVQAELKAAAAGRFADPSDAFAFVDTSKITVDDEGNVDLDEVEKALADLLKKKPHLAASTARFQGGADQGARKKTTGPTLDEQIAEAEKAKNFPRAIALKRQRQVANAAQNK
jgi:hypothetical protein